MTTPMARLSDSFKLFSKLVQNITIKTELNAKDSKYNSYRGRYIDSGMSKGVESDFIRIYRDKSSNQKSFAFAFNNFKEDINDTQIVVSIKDGEKFLVSYYGLSEFQALFKNLVHVVTVLEQTNNLTYPTIISACETVFNVTKEKNEINYRDVAQKMISLIDPELKSFLKTHADKKVIREEKNKVDKAIRKKVDAYRKELEKELGYRDLVKKEQKLDEKVDKLKQEAKAKLVDRVTNLKNFHKQLTTRTLKNNIITPTTEILSKEPYEITSFGQEVILAALENRTTSEKS